jgi:cytochrome oxidase Cu insertion factor (SCO1/SenC/PrrC family)
MWGPRPARPTGRAPAEAIGPAGGSGQAGRNAYILAMTENPVPAPHPLRHRLVVYGSALVLALALALGLGWYLSHPGGSSAQGEALIGGPFTLVDQHGKEVTEKDFAGRFMLVYFGYTFCPDVCPLSLSNMVQAIGLLEPGQADQVVPIFITVDPERDTVAQMAEYAPLFDPRLVALTGSTAQIKQAAKAYRVYFSKVENGSSSDYLMDHSAFIYLMGPDGKYRRHFGHDVSPEAMAEAIRTELAQG